MAVQVLWPQSNGIHTTLDLLPNQVFLGWRKLISQSGLPFWVNDGAQVTTNLGVLLVASSDFNLLDLYINYNKENQG